MLAMTGSIGLHIQAGNLAIRKLYLDVNPLLHR